MSRRSVPRKKSSLASNKNAVVYVRVSSKEQEVEGYSTDAQERLLREYATSRGFKIVEFYEEIETAKRSGRTQFNKMVKLLQSDKTIKHVIVEKTDRLYRNMKDYVVLDELDIYLHLVREHSILSKEVGSSEKLFHGFKVLMAKNYIDNLSEETEKGMREKAQQGTYPSLAPVGYLNAVSSSMKKTIIVDPAFGHIIPVLFTEYAAGNKSLEDVRRLAHDMGLRTRAGKPIGRSQIEYVLKNEFYCGCFYWLGIRYKGDHEPLVTQELFDRVQIELKRRGTHRSHAQVRNHLYRGLLHCGSCGGTMTGEEQKGHVYYHCTARTRSGCRVPYAREDAIDSAIAQALTNLRFDDEIFSWIKLALKQSKKDERQYREQQLTRLRQEVTKFQNRLDKLYEDKLDDLISPEDYQRRANDFRKQMDIAMGKIDAHMKADQAYAELGVELLELSQNIGPAYLTRSQAEKRKLVGIVFSNCVWNSGQITPSYRKPFDLIALSANKTISEKLSTEAQNRDCPKWLPR